MIYLLPPGISTVIGLAMIVWLMWAMLGRVVKGLGNTDAPRQRIELTHWQSDSGKSHIEEAYFYPNLKSFYAKVVCTEIDYSLNIWADSKDALEQKIQDKFKFCDEMIRDSINKREMKKPLYIHIG